MQATAPHDCPSRAKLCLCAPAESNRSGCYFDRNYTANRTRVPLIRSTELVSLSDYGIATPRGSCVAKGLVIRHGFAGVSSRFYGARQFPGSAIGLGLRQDLSGADLLNVILVNSNGYLSSSFLFSKDSRFEYMVFI
ncbi:hypothetical protein CEXT_356761 [Caerostris extrusa]|uniref:Uncharacterized protein n=1 Tax=Caerostris extrusa TaxID=172846 RepID=A0AAV4Y5K9_CAEEX|nr:hypothetical protein CEXT_356761 [Caerostris extrusa]